MQSKSILCGILVGLVGAAACLAEPRTNYVDGAAGDDANDGWTPAFPKKTIAAALQAVTVTGDTVLVAGGHYILTNTITITKQVALLGTAGPEATWIDGNHERRCLLIRGNAIVSGFTIMNGFDAAGYGGGVQMTNGLLANCTISNNISKEYGGGIYLANVGIVSNCLIIGNSVTNKYGGGIAVYNSGRVVNCDIIQNSATGVVDATAGGVQLNNGFVENCRIISNSSVFGGGVLKGFGTLRNCLVAHNQSGIQGGGVYIIQGAAGAIENCTIVSNRNNGIGCHALAIGYVANSVIYSNAANVSSPAGVSFTNCCVTPTNSLAGAGNITNAPLFVDFAAGDFQLAPGSPCINAGVYQPWMADALDLAGHRRLDRFTGVVDIGAYEYVSRGVFFSIR